jgi:hypothetical protein
LHHERQGELVTVSLLVSVAQRAVCEILPPEQFHPQHVRRNSPRWSIVQRGLFSTPCLLPSPSRATLAPIGRVLRRLAASRPAISRSACVELRNHPITFTVHRVLQSGAQRLQGPQSSNPSRAAHAPGALTVCTIAPMSRCRARGTDTPSVSRNNGHCKSCLNT